MSSTFPSRLDSSPVDSRQSRTINQSETITRENSTRRSLSGKVRDLFRKSSSSPNRAGMNDELSATAPDRHRSPSNSEQRKAPTEGPQLRAPTFRWPFGKKKSTLTERESLPTVNTKKTKTGRKDKQKAISTTEISNPIYDSTQQTSIRTQDFRPRTPEMTRNSIGRTQRPPSYDDSTPTKGFRDYVVINHTKPSREVAISDVDMVTSTYKPSNENSSPALNHRNLPDSKIEYLYQNDMTFPTTMIESNRSSPRLTPMHGAESLSATEILAGQVPLKPRNSSTSQSIKIPYSTDGKSPRKATSTSSISNHEARSIASSVEVDVPKLRPPVIPFGSSSSKKKPKPTSIISDEVYSSTSKNNGLFQTDQYRSSPDITTHHNTEYPGLCAILQSHLTPKPTLSYDYQRTPTISKKPPRFDTSTTTLDNYDQQQPWSNTQNSILSSNPLLSIHQHDGHIRPLTPQRPIIEIDVHPSHATVQTSNNYFTSETPQTYRSSTIIYTRDKQSNVNGGIIRTWSIHGHDGTNKNRKYSGSYFNENKKDDRPILPSKYTEQHRPINIEHDEENYEVNYDYKSHDSPRRYSNQLTNDRYTGQTIADQNSTFTRPINEFNNSREPLSSIENSPGTIRHYTLKRTNSYDGLGVLISTDKETGLNHRIREVEPMSPGYQIGLRKNDRIVSVNGVNVENTEFGNVLILIKQGLIHNNLQLSVIHD